MTEPVKHSKAGRPAGSKNKNSNLVEALEQASKKCPNAVKFINAVMDGDHKAASMTNRIACAFKLIELTQELEKIGAPDKKKTKAKETEADLDQTPRFSLTPATTAH